VALEDKIGEGVVGMHLRPREMKGWVISQQVVELELPKVVLGDLRRLNH
jgi:hypothetical protein